MTKQEFYAQDMLKIHWASAHAWLFPDLAADRNKTKGIIYPLFIMNKSYKINNAKYSELCKLLLK